jgi:hypothetical protein
MKKESKAINIVESIFYSLILTIVIVSLPFLLGMTLTSPNAEAINVIILSLCVVIEVIFIWLALLTDFIKDDARKESEEEDDI